MRFAKLSGVLLFGLLLINASPGRGNNRSEQTISGRLLYGNGEFGCDRCIVTLVRGDIQPVATAFVDLTGRFMFRNVPRGTYVIQAQIDGFEEVHQPVDTLDRLGIETDVTIMLVRKPVFNQPSGDNVIDISEFLGRFPKKAVALFKKGIDSRKKNDLRDATKHLEEAVRLAPDFYQAHNELGLAYKHSGRFDEAERHFLRAHELNESSADPLVNLTSLYIDRDKPDRAVITGEEAVKKNSRSASAFFNLGMALYKVSMMDRAETALKKALELAPKMANVRLMLANVYMKLRNRDKLMEQLDAYLAENPTGDHRENVLGMRRKLLDAQAEGQP